MNAEPAAVSWDFELQLVGVAGTETETSLDDYAGILHDAIEAQDDVTYVSVGWNATTPDLTLHLQMRFGPDVHGEDVVVRFFAVVREAMAETGVARLVGAPLAPASVPMGHFEASPVAMAV